MTLHDRITRLERGRRPVAYEAPPVAKTMEEWQARLNEPRPPPPPPGAIVRGYINAPPVAKSMEEWTAWVNRRP